MQFSKEPSVIRSAMSEHELKKSIEWKSYHYLVGDDANKRSRYCSSIYNVDDLLSYYELFVKWYERKFDVKFSAITLPYSVYESSERVERLMDRLKVDTVVGQGAAALEYLKKTSNADDRTTLLIDGGFNTINVEIIEGSEVVYYETYYNQFGTRDLIEKYFKSLVRHKIPDISPNAIRLDEVLKNGYADFNFQRVYFEKEKEEAIERYIADVFRQIKNGITNELMDFEQVVIVGGLAYYMSPEQIETSKALVIPAEHAEYLNVLGASLKTGYKPALDLGFGYAKYIK